MNDKMIPAFLFRLFRLAALSTLFSIALPPIVFSATPLNDLRKQAAEWSGTLPGGAYITKQHLDELVTAHEQWLLTADQKFEARWSEAQSKGQVTDLDWYKALYSSSWESGEGRLVLKNAMLKGADLARRNLKYANLEEVDLSGANMAGANLVSAVLVNAKLGGANFIGASLGSAYLTEAFLSSAYLGGADLRGADLTRSYCYKTIFSGANLRGADIEEALLSEADMNGVLYQPQPGSMPVVWAMASSTNLHTMWFEDIPQSMVELRREFRNAGFRQQERQITHAIKRSEQRNAWVDGEYIQPLLSYIFFDLPVGYGLYPGRALKILALLVVVFSLPYGVAIAIASRQHNIWRVWPGKTCESELAGHKDNDDSQAELLPRDWRIATFGFYFSLLSAFHIGWRELNIGNWITRIQFKSYSLQPTGYVRAISGIQSLISVYLLAMWVLTYFGRPFDAL